MDFDAALVDAFRELDIEIVDARPSFVAAGVHLELKRHPLVTENSARTLLSAHDSDHVLVVVADRVARDGRDVLLRGGAGYLDLRGYLALRAPGLVIDAKVTPRVERATRKDPLSGVVGIEVAVALLMKPTVASPVREMARSLGRSVSTVSEVMQGLRELELIGPKGTVVDDRLFWEVAAHWPQQRDLLASAPEHPVALTGLTAARELGATVDGDALVEFYVADSATLAQTVAECGEAPSVAEARAIVRVAPIPGVVRDDERLVHPVFVALDLAARDGGSDMLAEWTPASPWRRVW